METESGVLELRNRALVLCVWAQKQQGPICVSGSQPGSTGPIQNLEMGTKSCILRLLNRKQPQVWGAGNRARLASFGLREIKSCSLGAQNKAHMARFRAEK